MKTNLDANHRPLQRPDGPAPGGPVDAPSASQRPPEVPRAPAAPVAAPPRAPWLAGLRRLAAPAAAALLGIGFGTRASAAEAPRPSPRAPVQQVGAMLPVQRGASVGLLMDYTATDFEAGAAVSRAFGAATARLRALGTERPEVLADILAQVFGARMTPGAKAALLRAARQGDLPIPARIEVVSAESLGGADAAYAAAKGGTLFVSDGATGDPERLVGVLLEELGHHLDAQLGPGDAVGDEGQLFRLAVERGRILTQPELRSGRLDRDRRQLEIAGERVDVELSTRAEDRAYEQAGAFGDADVRRGAEARLAASVDAELVARAAAEDPAVGTLEAAEAHFAAAGADLDEVRRAAEAAIVGDDREGVLAGLGKEVVKEAVTSSVVVRLKEGGVLPRATTLDTPLPPRTRARVDADEALSRQDPPIRTWGALMQGLAGDVDGDGRLDFDALTLARFLPDATGQDILRASMTELTPTQMREKLAGVGFDNPIVDGMSLGSALDLTPPKLFGLRGRTKVDDMQQQLLLRTGKVFVDSNHDGEVDDGDAVHFVDRDGTVKEATYGELPEKLKKLVQLNLATAEVARDYAARPATERMRFPHYDSATGESGEERVNEALWTVSVAEANRGQTSWELKPGARPSEALDDVFGGNGGAYTTECAHGRTLIRLQGLKAYYDNQHGEGAGAYRFDALFAKSPRDARAAESYLAGFEAHRAEHPGASWADYVEASPPPQVEYALEVSRHRVYGHREAVIEPWRRERMGSAAGDTGYFHNHSVSVEGVRIGYVGENVIDLGYTDGERLYWGHPGGIQTEKSWQGELASRKIAVHEMKTFGQYFSHLDVKRGSKRVTETRVEEAEKKIRDLEERRPAGFEGQVEQLRGTVGWWTALDEVRRGLVDHLDRDRLDAAEQLFSRQLRLRGPEDGAAIRALLTDDGVAAMAKAFEHLDEDARASGARSFGADGPEALTPAQRADVALVATLGQRGGMHPYLRQEAQGIVETERFLANADMLEGDGPMASKASFARWLGSEAFRGWYREQTGRDWAQETDLAKLPHAEIKKLVELAFPMVAGKRTIYAEVNRGSQLLADQMATLLKEGKLPDAEYRVDSLAVAPLG